MLLYFKMCYKSLQNIVETITWSCLRDVCQRAYLIHHVNVRNENPRQYSGIVYPKHLILFLKILLLFSLNATGIMYSSIQTSLAWSMCFSAVFENTIISSRNDGQKVYKSRTMEPHCACNVTEQFHIPQRHASKLIWPYVNSNGLSNQALLQT